MRMNEVAFMPKATPSGELAFKKMATLSRTPVEWRRQPARCAGICRHAEPCIGSGAAACGIWVPAPLPKKTNSSLTFRAGKFSRTQETGNLHMRLVLFLDLTINRGGVVGEGGFVFGILAEILILFHVNARLHLFERRAFFAQAVHLLIQVVHIVSETSQISFCRQFEVPRDNVVDRQFQRRIKRFNPAFHAALVHCR
jgi:hypothetical protein